MKMFNSEDEGFHFYNNYAEKGFSVRKDYCEWDRDLDESERIKMSTRGGE
jgi:zinc finger SWIM domain-containing protein 3